MSSELSILLKNDKLTYKAVLENLFNKHNDIVLDAIRKLVQEPKVTKSLTAEEKESRAKARADKKAYKEKMIKDLGGKSNVTEEQIDNAMKLYDKEVKKAKQAKAVEKEESDDSGSDSDNPWDDPHEICGNKVTVQPKKVEPKKVEPKKVEPKKVEPTKVEPKKVDSDDEPNVEPKKVEPKKVEPKKVEPKKVDRVESDDSDDEPNVEPKKVEPKKVDSDDSDDEPKVPKKVVPKPGKKKKVQKSPETDSD
jgi:hypothetical protein